MRVLLTSTAGWGHVHPMVPLARAFVDGGDDVLWAVAADVGAQLEGDGFQAKPAGLSMRDGMTAFRDRYPNLDAMLPTQRSNVMFPGMFGRVLAAPMLADLLPITEAWSPSLVVSENGEFAGPIAAAATGVACVTHSFGALTPSARVAAAAEEVAPLWKAQGLQPPPYGGRYEHLYLDIYPSSLQLGDRSHVPATQSLRPGAFARSGGAKLPDWFHDTSATPLVYVTFGTVFTDGDALTAVVNAVRELPVRVVVTVGPDGDPAALGPQPASVHVARYIPHHQLVARSSVVVSHGGSGTFLAALAAGVPQVCLPQGADQFLNASACTRSGCGLVLAPGAASDEHIRAAVERLLTEGSFRTAALRVSREIEAMPSPQVVADRLRTTYG